MEHIQALNTPTNRHQRGFRVSIWAGSDTQPGCRANWIIYGTNITAVVGRGLRSFRRGVAANKRYSDWTVNVAAIREGEIILPAVK